ncbi:MAG: hypothetical protein R2685_10865 [Candidatus Nitrosocosmicus sp.]|nr:hypothetical protein [Candidatus Nitrosocosmicus sp.]
MANIEEIINQLIETKDKPIGFVYNGRSIYLNERKEGKHIIIEIQYSDLVK